MIALALDTAHEFGSLALHSDDELIDEILLHAPGGFSSVLFDSIGSLLKRNGIGSQDVGLYAAGAGPGSFTGVRIGLAAAKALAAAQGKPCFGISNLAAMAKAGGATSRAAFLDARRGEIYGGVFGTPEAPETVAPLPQWLASLSPEVEEFVTFDFAPFESTLAQSRFSCAARTLTPRALAAAIAALGLERLHAGDSGDPAIVDANYVRRADAELLWRDRE